MTPRPAVPIWREHLLKLLVRIALAYEDSDKAKQDQIGRQLRPVMTRIKTRNTTAALDEQTREHIVNDIAEAHTTLTTIMGEQWQPTGQLAQTMRRKGILHQVT